MKVLFDLPDELSDKIHARIKLSTAEMYDLLAIYIDSPIQACVYTFDRNWWNAPYKAESEEV